MTYFNHNHFFKKVLLIIILFSLHGCEGSLLNAHGWIALQEHSLIIISFLVMLLIVIPVIFMSIYFAFKYRSTNLNQVYEPHWSHSKKIETIVWGVPVLMISFLGFLSWNYTHILEPKKSILSCNNPIRINVVSLDWKWLFIYPDYHIATINEIMFPVNRPIVFNITSQSVMNSFFIPSLGSQIYAMPGMVTRLNLISNEPGLYKGISSNYSGKGFSNMKFSVISVANDHIFKKWIKKIQRSSNTLNTIKTFYLIATPNENYSKKYFSHVNKNLFNHILHQYSKIQH
ncbi:ubiquinol oxidase subunit II [Buchnera aphidicola (Hyadaphis tataricae)]|uniref:Ubiquinol oxidase subunit 2 n=1 Tax=Buchnera aphidicola (Hyadaphis tataricae) TaxID=1241859 RepID=A0A4D6XV85_9GAMM|nr:ubiquinol oxidase subunit II [Buchnera aphidicola]QCI21752.1 ubiquinol oxidase subunit II [Buchnera aphidicola (Hyadaphis tataricae)]